MVKFKFKVGMICEVISTHNRQCNRGVTLGTFCKIMRHDIVFNIDDPSFPGYINYMVHFLPEHKFKLLNTQGPFIFEHEMRLTDTGLVLFGEV